jgi:hypothetical protein
MNPAVARIALSYEACELAELAGAAVPTDRSTPEAVAQAAQILQAAHRLLTTAVLAAQADNIPWPEIATLLTPTAQVATSWRTHLLANPHEAAEDLDDWVTRHAETDPGPTPVSQILI